MAYLLKSFHLSAYTIHLFFQVVYLSAGILSILIIVIVYSRCANPHDFVISESDHSCFLASDCVFFFCLCSFDFVYVFVCLLSCLVTFFFGKPDKIYWVKELG